MPRKIREPSATTMLLYFDNEGEKNKNIFKNPTNFLKVSPLRVNDKEVNLTQHNEFYCNTPHYFGIR